MNCWLFGVRGIRHTHTHEQFPWNLFKQISTILMIRRRKFWFFKLDKAPNVAAIRAMYIEIFGSFRQIVENMLFVLNHLHKVRSLFAGPCYWSWRHQFKRLKVAQYSDHGQLDFELFTDAMSCASVFVYRNQNKNLVEFHKIFTNFGIIIWKIVRFILAYSINFTKFDWNYRFDWNLLFVIWSGFCKHLINIQCHRRCYIS